MDKVKLKHDICMLYLLNNKLFLCFSYSFYIDVMIQFMPQCYLCHLDLDNMPQCYFDLWTAGGHLN